MENNLMTHPRIVLASLSPRRAELMREHFKYVQITTLKIDEVCSKTKPEEIVLDLARQKLGDLYMNHNYEVVVSADTIVYFNEKVYGKPRDKRVARKYLRELSNNTHEVYTGVCVAYKGHIEKFYEKSLVTFNDLSAEDIEKYIEECKPMDKAGAYGIQDKQVVKSYEGDYDNIVGLPMTKLLEVIKDMEKKYEKC